MFVFDLSKGFSEKLLQSSPKDEERLGNPRHGSIQASCSIIPMRGSSDIASIRSML